MRRINGHLWRVTTLASFGALVLLAGAGVDGAAASPIASTPVAQAAQAAQTVTSGDPAADRLRLVTFGFLGLAVLLFATTVVYWIATRPDPISRDQGDTGEHDGDAEADPAPSVEFHGSDEVVAAERATAQASTPEPALAAPAPEPALSAPAPEPALPAPTPALRSNPTASTAAPSGTFDSDEFDSDEFDTAAIDLTDGARSTVAGPDPVASPLSAALAAIPDMEPTVVRFDDPPVQRVRRPLPPPGAPNFDRMARENTARHEAVESARRVEQRPRRVQRTIDPREARSTAPSAEASSAPAPSAPASSAPSPDGTASSVPALSSPALPRRIDPNEPPVRRRFDPFPQRRVLRGEAAESEPPAPTTPEAPKSAPTMAQGPIVEPDVSVEAPRPPVRGYRGD